MPRPASPFRTAIFYGASDDHATELGPHQASVIRNLYRDRGKLVGRKGTIPHTDREMAGTGAECDGIFWARIETDDHLFVAAHGDLWDVFPPVPPTQMTNGANKLTSGDPVTFAWIDQKVYCGDGTLPNVRLNATRVDQVMPDPPVGGSATVIAGGSLGTGVTYSYRIVFLSADGNETQAGTAFAANTATSAGNQQIRVTLPIATAGQDCSGRRIYRTSASGSTYKVVTTVSDNVTLTYDDTVADASLGDTLSSQDRRAFPPSAILVHHDGRLLGARSYDADFDRQTLYISNYREPWWCPAAPDLEDPNQGTEIALQGPAAGEITGIASHGDRAWVFTWDACYVLIGDQPIDFSLKHFTRIGCVAHRTIQSTRDRLIWLAADGVYEAREGVGIRRLSDPIDTFLKGRTAAQMAGAHAFVWDDRYYLCFPDEARYLDLEYSDGENLQWGELTGWPWNCSTVAFASETRLPRIFAGRSESPRVWELETGEDDDGEEIPCVYTSPQWDLGNPGREKRIQYVGATFAVGTGDATVTLTKGTGGTVEAYTVDLEEPTEEDGTIVRLFQRAVEEARGEYFALSVSHEKTAAYSLLSVDGLWSLAT